MADITGTSVLGVQTIGSFDSDDIGFAIAIAPPYNNPLLQVGTVLTQVSNDLGIQTWATFPLYGNGRANTDIPPTAFGGRVLAVNWRFEGVAWTARFG